MDGIYCRVVDVDDPGMVGISLFDMEAEAWSKWLRRLGSVAQLIYVVRLDEMLAAGGMTLGDLIKLG